MSSKDQLRRNTNHNGNPDSQFFDFSWHNGEKKIIHGSIQKQVHIFVFANVDTKMKTILFILVEMIHSTLHKYQENQIQKLVLQLCLRFSGKYDIHKHYRLPSCTCQANTDGAELQYRPTTFANKRGFFLTFSSHS